MQTIKMKCPHCGFIRRFEASATEYLSHALVAQVAGLSGSLLNLVGKLRQLTGRADLAEANAWIDVPACPHCDRSYQYDVRTGQTR
jgi:transposase-like protein